MSETPMRRALLTPDEAHKSYGVPVSRATFYRALAAGEIPSVRLGRRILIPRHAFEAAMGLAEQPAA